MTIRVRSHFSQTSIQLTRRLLINGMIVLLILAIALTNGSSGTAQGRAQADPVQLRIVHAAPDAPALDLIIGGEAVAEGLVYAAESESLIAIGAATSD